LALLGLILCDQWIGWFQGPVLWDGQRMQVAYGPGSYVALYFCYGLNILSFILCGRWIIMAKGLRRRQAVALSIIPVFSFLGHVVGYMLTFSDFMPQLIGFMFSGIYTTWAFYRWRVYSILPLAQDEVTNAMIDGLMVVDDKGYIVEMNPAAKTVCCGLPATVDGKFSALVSAWPPMENIGGMPFEVSRVIHGEMCYFEVQTLLLRTPQGQLLGKTIIFKDITRQKRDQAQLIEQQKAIAVLTERERLGREMHDGPGQLWNYLQLELKALHALVAGGKNSAAETSIEQLIARIKQVNYDVRESIVGLNSSKLCEHDFIRSLEKYFRWFEQNYHIAVKLYLPVNPVDWYISSAQEVQLLRIIQEALNNIRKYAGVQEAEVALKKDGANFIVTIGDKGQGFDLASVETGHYGLKIMRERAEEAGGNFLVESQPGQGTKITVVF
jgi:signal transduction histidine kinase